MPPPVPPRPAVASGEGGPRPFQMPQPAPMRPAPELKTPPPPGPDVRIRSLATDAESLAASGGAGAEAKTIRLEELDDETSAFAPETVGALPEGVATEGKPSMKLIAVIGGSIAGVIVLGLIGYYLVYPLFFTTPVPEPITEPAPADNAPQTLPHVSLFATPLPSQAQINLPSVTPNEIRAAVAREVMNHPAPHVMDELAVFMNGSQVPFADFINALVPELSSATVKNLVADDFSGFAYFDNNGHWPGYVAALRPEAIPSEAQSVFAQMESANLAALYVNDPGAKGEFKSGQVNGVPTRYSIFTTPGASFNYGIFGNYLVISTSFDGLKSILPFLGL